MRVIDVVRQLNQSGSLKIFSRAGVVNASLVKHYEFYGEYERLMAKKRGGKMDCVSEASEKFKISERQGRNIIKSMEETIDRSLI